MLLVIVAKSEAMVVEPVMVAASIDAEEIVDVATPVKLVTTAALVAIVAILVQEVAAGTVAETVTPTVRQRDFAKAKAAGTRISSGFGSYLGSGQGLLA